MSDERKPFLSRWSQRKLAAAREGAAREAPVREAIVAPPAPANVPEPAAAAPASATKDAAAEPSLPPIESLSMDSDFTPFMQPKVDESLKRQALRKLFADPHFNVMDGLDVYIDDYSKSEPMTPEILAQLNHAKFLFDPPKTRINAQGHVEDVPPEPEPAPVAAVDANAEAAEREPREAVGDKHHESLAADQPTSVAASDLPSGDNAAPAVKPGS